MEQMRKLPIGIQTFEKIREGGYLYVDKTAMIYQIVQTSVPYFQGRKDLFGGLALGELESRWEKCPVLYLDLNAEKYDSAEVLESFLSWKLSVWEDAYGADKSEDSLSARFAGVTKFAQVSVFSDLNQLYDISMHPAYSTLCGIADAVDGRRVVKVGVNFSRETRNIDEYIVVFD